MNKKLELLEIKKLLQEYSFLNIDDEFKGFNILRSIDRYYYNDTDFLMLRDFLSSEIKKGKEKGTYKVSIAHAMRANGSAEGITYLKGITDVGLRVETVEKP